ncbi:hypothetical protein GLW08_19570 [Pontibacillus yanchengensis]|uniref:Uncharacterized protein n=2 Tax=Pontibacillus yanchengensis TaxID=462910 RepID=A0ACC7VMG4_9BACI|nr:hypothetical protein [Pontibacillus yanchengensis]MYL35552.1 hypothetical protein [Pontibacillus yanchengensis]MYL55509.1 hypothetical protein [Pontibacillus yanchengensis]
MCKDSELLDEIINELERQNAINLLPNPEKEIYEYCLFVDFKMSNEAKNPGEYVLMDSIATPIERTANKYGMTPDEVIEILQSANYMIDKMLCLDT